MFLNSKIIKFLTFSIIISIFSYITFAQDRVGEYEKSLGTSFLNYGVGSNIVGVLENLINFLLTLGYTLVVLFLGISGFKFITSAGDKGKKTEAMDSLKYTLIAFLALIGLNVFLNIFINIFKSDTTGITATVSLEETF